MAAPDARRPPVSSVRPEAEAAAAGNNVPDSAPELAASCFAAATMADLPELQHVLDSGFVHREGKRRKKW